MNEMFRTAAAVLVIAAGLRAAEPPTVLTSRLADQAELFAAKALHAVTQEHLLQRSFAVPQHAHFAIGAAAVPVHPQYVVNEVISEYSVSSLKGDASGDLVEFREIVSMNGKVVQTPEAALKAMALDIHAGEERIRKKILVEFTKFGLVDVATDYGLILLAFTRRGQSTLALEEGGSAWIGVDDTAVWKWRQLSGGALEFRGNKTERRPMHGSIWIRKSDGTPLRISASMEHDEPQHHLRDDASIDYVLSSFGCATPATVVHRHFVDGVPLTENLLSYAPFRLFTTDTKILQFGEPGSPDKQ
jgi:hypothetical protein